MPSSVLLPTPLPPNRPMRWPRPQVSRPSMARTPVPIGVDDRLARQRVQRRRMQRRGRSSRAPARGRRAGGRARRGRGRAARARPATGRCRRARRSCRRAGCRRWCRAARSAGSRRGSPRPRAASAAPARLLQLAQLADLGPRTARFDQQADRAHDVADERDGIGGLGGGEIARERQGTSAVMTRSRSAVAAEQRPRSARRTARSMVASTLPKADSTRQPPREIDGSGTTVTVWPVPARAVLAPRSV